MFDAGTVQICALVNTASQGDMPVQKLAPLTSAYFEERIVGFNRYFAAQGVNEQVDLLIRVWRNGAARAGRFAVLSMSEYDGQYRIIQVQHLLNDDGLKVTDISLSRLENNYDVTNETV